MKTIGQISDVADLEAGEQAFPETGITYFIRSIDSIQVSEVPVDYVQRRGNSLYAHGNWRSPCVEVAGNNANYVLVPRQQA